MNIPKNSAYKRYLIYLMGDDDAVYSNMVLLLSNRNMQLTLFRSHDKLMLTINPYPLIR